MSGSHSLRPFLQIIVISVIFALSAFFPTERVGHTSLPQYQGGTVTGRIQTLCLIGNVEVQFYMIYVIRIVSLTYAIKFTVIKVTLFIIIIYIIFSSSFVFLLLTFIPRQKRDHDITIGRSHG